jgi:flagellar FliL protein
MPNFADTTEGLIMADEKKESKENFVPAPDGGGGGPKGPLLTIILVLNLALMGGLGFMQFKMHKKIESQPDINSVLKAAGIEPGGGHGEAGAKGEGKKEEAGGHGAPAAGGKPGEEGKRADGTFLVPLKDFTANLAAGEGPKRFIRMGAVLKFSKESKKEEFDSREAQIKDVILTILNSKKAEDLLKVEGKNYLKEEIKSSINAFLEDGNVIDVYYVGFQIL